MFSSSEKNPFNLNIVPRSFSYSARTYLHNNPKLIAIQSNSPEALLGCFQSEIASSKKFGSKARMQREHAIRRQAYHRRS